MISQLNVALGGKPNILTPHSPLQQQQSQATSSVIETGSRRSNNYSSPIHVSKRNNQSLRNQHRNQRRPRLADEDVFAESGVMRNSNSRRGQTSITHLINFSLPHRSFNEGPRRNITTGLGSRYHAVDKARYIHSTYRFIVNPNRDYHAQVTNADVPLEWNDVLQILASAVSQASSCPICLSHPVAPRMAKCGHIFCLPCLIRYMHSTDDANLIPEKKSRWKKCPICWDSVYMTETRPVRWHIGQEGPAPREGDDVVLRLVTRQPGNTLALPRDAADAVGKLGDIPWYMVAEVTDYARVMKGSEDYMMAEFDAEIEEIRRQEKEDEIMFAEETEWAKKAISAVNEAKDRVRGIGNPPSFPNQPKEKKPNKISIESNSEVPELYLTQHTVRSGHSSLTGSSTPISMGSTESKDADFQNTPSQPSDPTEEAQGTHPSLNTKCARISVNTDQDPPYFFYQALLHYYLAPLDIRILKSTFGGFSSFPTTILPRVEHISTGHIVDDDLRKRAKYLAHLPYGCEVNFLECDWIDIVKPEILEKFRGEIEKRRRKNLEKENKEEKARLRAEKEEDDKRWAATRRRRPNTPPDESFKDYFQPSTSSVNAAGTSPPWPLRQGSSFTTLATPHTSPIPARTVWGTPLIPPATTESSAQQLESRRDDGWLSGWKDDPAQNKLTGQAQGTPLNENGDSATATLPGSAGKKKKAKKITLMSTTARRAA